MTFEPTKFRFAFASSVFPLFGIGTICLNVPQRLHDEQWGVAAVIILFGFGLVALWLWNGFLSARKAPSITINNEGISFSAKEKEEPILFPWISIKKVKIELRSMNPSISITAVPAVLGPPPPEADYVIANFKLDPYRAKFDLVKEIQRHIPDKVENFNAEMLTSSMYLKQKALAIFGSTLLIIGLWIGIFVIAWWIYRSR